MSGMPTDNRKENTRFRQSFRLRSASSDRSAGLRLHAAHIVGHEECATTLCRRTYAQAKSH